MNALGRHLLVELHECDRGLLNDLDYIRKSMLTAAMDCGAVILGDSFHRFSPQGVSGVVVIAESHLSVHTWPEFGYAAVDIFTCGTTVDPQKAATVLIDKLGSRNPSLTEIKRGILVTV
ncbi:MAG: S-adenosylmethionine decarboxylase proenzyme [Chloroflexi bacterium RBG_16_56_11]|nr:MAG: S-adenosylmethionine decarboxylase proenzyme [Chloroflexi bacterium RBG_16_56_11]